MSECLAIPPLTRADICGGQAGLTRRARWVHVIDHHDIEDSLIGGELILSSGVTLGHDQALQRTIFPIMERRLCAGLLLSIGAYIQDVPDIMVQEAERFGIPLLTIPWAVNFRDVTQVLLTRIVRTQYRLLEEAERINRSLLRIALGRGTLDDLCQRLAEATERRVAVVDPMFEPVAGDLAARTDPLFPRLFAPASAPPRSAEPAVELVTTARGRRAIKAPIVITSRLQGYLILDTGDETPERFESMIVEAASLVAALIIAQTEEIERITTSKERDSFVALIEGGQDPSRIAAFGPIAPGPYSLLIVEVEGGAVEADRRLVRRALDQAGAQARISEYAQQVIVLLPQSRRQSARVIARQVLDRLDPAPGTPRLALSRPFGSLLELRQAYAEAQEAFAVGRALDPEARLYCAEDSAALRQFARSLASGAAPGFGRLRRLADHDAAHGSELMATLEGYLAANQNAAVTARRLAIHRHTLAYRLDRVTEILGITLTPELALDLRLEFIAHRLSGPASPP